MSLWLRHRLARAVTSANQPLVPASFCRLMWDVPTNLGGSRRFWVYLKQVQPPTCTCPCELPRQLLLRTRCPGTSNRDVVKPLLPVVAEERENQSGRGSRHYGGNGWGRGIKSRVLPRPCLPPSPTAYMASSDKEKTGMAYLQISCMAHTDNCLWMAGDCSTLDLVLCTLGRDKT